MMPDLKPKAFGVNNCVVHLIPSDFRFVVMIRRKLSQVIRGSRWDAIPAES
jgi:hypothetical protein